MTIEELAARKVAIQQTLEGMKMMNIYGRTLKELTEFEVERIKLSRELWSIEGQIVAYISHANEPNQDTDSGDNKR